jgi:hypothetical protein
VSSLQKVAFCSDSQSSLSKFTCVYTSKNFPLK